MVDGPMISPAPIAVPGAIKLSNPRLSFRAARFISLGDGGALIIRLLTLCQCDLDLSSSILQVDPRRHDGHTLDPDVIPQLANLFLMQEQSAFAARLVIETIGLFVGGDMRLHQPGLFAILYI